ncbi:MAG: pantoate--beta-alanine ligase [Deltaproteobacteria bacterium]|nr:pantoate--beta-alanine ligase [Deltaproteobacteria bacterium]
MELMTNLDRWREVRRGLSGPLGLVATMGWLHEGHLTLVRRAKAENRVVVVTLFVNPTQFGPGEDLAAYPRDLDRDRRLLEAEGVDFLLAPPVDQVYPPGFQTYVTVTALSRNLEGAARPGHFQGVATVVAKLFHLTRPDRAYFGQKDGQQAAVIRRMALDLDFPLEVVVCPTVREADGLAMSSRNMYLSVAERQAAPVLHKALRAAAHTLFPSAAGSGGVTAETLRDVVRQTVAEQPLARLEYVSVAWLDSLEEADGPALTPDSPPLMISLAARLGQTRLIDNILLGVG